jgi:hypothetical protein
MVHHPNLDLFRVLENVHRQGRICVPAHPFRGWDSFGEKVLKLDGIDAIEIHNGLDSEEKNRKATHLATIKSLLSSEEATATKKHR